MKHLEKHNGTNGSGEAIFLIVTVSDENGEWLHIETFTNEAEANNWIKWA